MTTMPLPSSFCSSNRLILFTASGLHLLYPCGNALYRFSSECLLIFPPASQRGLHDNPLYTVKIVPFSKHPMAPLESPSVGSLRAKWRHSSAGANITKYHIRVPRRWDKMLVGVLLPSEDCGRYSGSVPLPQLLVVCWQAWCSRLQLLHPHLCLQVTWCSPCGCVCFQISPSYKADLGPPLFRYDLIFNWLHLQ